MTIQAYIWRTRKARCMSMIRNPIPPVPAIISEITARMSPSAMLSRMPAKINGAEAGRMTLRKARTARRRAFAPY